MERIMKKIVVILILSITFMGCLTTSNDKIINLEPGKGIVLFNANSNNMTKFELFYQKKTNSLDLSGYLHMNKTVMSKYSYDIVIIEAGEYLFSKVEKGNTLIDFPEHNGFIVEAGKINYLGDITINQEERNFKDVLEVEVEDNLNKTMSEALNDLPALSDYEIVKNLIEVYK